MSTELVPISVEHDGAMWPLWQSAGSKEPLAKDLDVAAWLGYEHPRRIRSLIKGHAIDLGEVRTAAVQTTEKGGRPSAAYLLTEEQALFIAAKSETPKATQVLKAMIAVFLRARDMMRGAAPAFSAADVDRIIDATAHETVRQLTQDAGTLTAIAQKVRALLGPLTVADGGGAATDPEIIARRAAELVLRDIGAQGEHIMGLIRGARRDIVEGGDLTRELVGRTGKVGDQAAVARHNQMAEALRRAFLNLGTQGKEHASELLTAIAQTRAELAEVSEMLQGHPGITRLAVDAALRDAEARLVAKVAQVAAQDRAPGPIAGARVNTAGAAAILGIMPNTIRQRIRRGDEELRACVVLRRGMRDVFDVTKLQAYLRRMERA